MRESDIERRLVQGVKKLGGKAYKFVSPGNVVCLTGWLFCREA